MRLPGRLFFVHIVLDFRLMEMMLKFIGHDNLQQTRPYRVLYLLFVALFIICTFTDACADSLCPPSFFYYELNEDEPAAINTDKHDLNANRQFIDVRKAPKYVSPYYRALVKPRSIEDSPVSLIVPVQNSAHDIKSSQICPPVSSDPSPPAV
jgi:hypothetical protein